MTDPADPLVARRPGGIARSLARLIAALPAALLRRRARAAARRGDWTGAASLYRRITAGAGAAPGDWVRLGHAAKEAGDPIAAEAAYRAAADRHPRNPDAQRQLGLYLRRRERDDEAIELLARAAAILPGDAALRAELADLGVGDAMRAERTLTALLRTAVRPAPIVPEADPAMEIGICHRLLLADPYDAAVHLRRARALAAQGLGPAALQAALAAWRLRPGLPAAAALLRDMGWGDADLHRLTVRSWAPLLPDQLGPDPRRLPDGLSRREAALWSRLDDAVAHAG